MFAVTFAARAPVVEFVAPAPSVTCAAPVATMTVVTGKDVTLPVSTVSIASATVSPSTYGVLPTIYGTVLFRCVETQMNFVISIDGAVCRRHSVQCVHLNCIFSLFFSFTRLT